MSCGDQDRVCVVTRRIEKAAVDVYPGGRANQPLACDELLPQVQQDTGLIVAVELDVLYHRSVDGQAVQ
jgi:hypothetical protein